MPGSRGLIRKPVADGNSEKRCGLCMVMSIQPTAQGLREKQSGHDQKVPNGGALRRGQPNLVRVTKDERLGRRFVSMPAKSLPSSKVLAAI